MVEQFDQWLNLAKQMFRYCFHPYYHLLLCFFNKFLVKKIQKKGKHYIDNEVFEQTIQDYLVDPRKNEDALVKQLDLLISSILISFKFKVDHDDAKQECFLLSLKVLKNFTHQRGSAFNYFTTVIVNNLKLIYTKNKRYAEKMQEHKDRQIKSFLDQD